MSCGPLWRGPAADRREEGALRGSVTASSLGEGREGSKGRRGGEEGRERSEGRQGAKEKGEEEKVEKGQENASTLISKTHLKIFSIRNCSSSDVMGISLHSGERYTCVYGTVTMCMYMAQYTHSTTHAPAHVSDMEDRGGSPSTGGDH